MMAAESTTTNAMIGEDAQGDGELNTTANDIGNDRQPIAVTPLVATNGTMVNNTQNGSSNLNAQQPEIDDDGNDDEAEDDEENDDGN